MGDGCDDWFSTVHPNDAETPSYRGFWCPTGKTNMYNAARSQPGHQLQSLTSAMQPNPTLPAPPAKPAVVERAGRISQCLTYSSLISG